MPLQLDLGDRVKVRLDSSFWRSQGWFEGVVQKVQPYSQHRRFYWIELDQEVEGIDGSRTRFVSVFNPSNYQKL